MGVMGAMAERKEVGMVVRVSLDRLSEEVDCYFANGKERLMN